MSTKRLIVGRSNGGGLVGWNGQAFKRPAHIYDEETEAGREEIVRELERARRYAHGRFVDARVLVVDAALQSPPSALPTADEYDAQSATWTLGESGVAWEAARDAEEAHRSCRLWMPCCNGDAVAAGRSAAIAAVAQLRSVRL